MNRQQERAQALAHQTEAFAEIDGLMAAIREAVTRLVEAHAAAKRAQTELAEANRQISGPEFVQERISA